MNGIMVWAWMLWLSHSLTDERKYGFGMDAAGPRILLEHKRNYGLGMDALVTVCSWNTNGIMAWVCMLWFSHSSKHERNCGLGMDVLVVTLIKRWTEVWFRHGCSDDRMRLENERNYGLGMDALVIALALTREPAGLFNKARPR